jgi:G:T-mismatch repair DNA endonuclease (very short patch repair protein)
MSLAHKGKGHRPWTDEEKQKFSLIKKGKPQLQKRKPCPDIRKVKRLYCDEGYSLQEIGNIFGCYDKPVRRWLAEAGVAVIKKFTPEFDRKRIAALHKRPTKPESQLSKLLTTNNLPYRYVGNGEVILGGKNPDFINVNGQKKLIEVFGTYWHDPFDIAERTEHFRQYGFNTLIIWEDELKEPEKVVAKIKSFNQRRNKP